MVICLLHYLCLFQGLYEVPTDLRISASGNHWADIVKGKYRATVQVVNKGLQLACYVASFTLITVKN